MNAFTSQFSGAYKNKKVWLSGHTGFKGSWLAQWLLELGAEVHGYALAPTATQPLFDQLGLASRLHHQVADIRDHNALEKSLLSFQPDFVFHLAAQPLVRYSYAEPLETYETNVMGTIYLLETLRKYQAKRPLEKAPVAAVMITTDKCYENLSSKTTEAANSCVAPVLAPSSMPYTLDCCAPSTPCSSSASASLQTGSESCRQGIPFSEEASLGGHDPYSSSKAMDEIAIAAYRSSFFQQGSRIRLASARAGNVIGGGDMALDRILPDCIRSLEKKIPIIVRHPNATRPWQHVLEPLSGYLWLGAQLIEDPEVATAFNFGPDPTENYSVYNLVCELLKHWPGTWKEENDPNALHEAPLLNLSIAKAASLLAWRPVWNFPETVAQTVAWYRSHAENLSSQSTTAATAIVAPVLAPSSMPYTLDCCAPSAPYPSSAVATVKTGSDCAKSDLVFTQHQIAAYTAAARAAGVAWAERNSPQGSQSR